MLLTHLSRIIIYEINNKYTSLTSQRISYMHDFLIEPSIISISYLMTISLLDLQILRLFILISLTSAIDWLNLLTSFLIIWSSCESLKTLFRLSYTTTFLMSARMIDFYENKEELRTKSLVNFIGGIILWTMFGLIIHSLSYWDFLFILFILWTLWRRHVSDKQYLITTIWMKGTQIFIINLNQSEDPYSISFLWYPSILILSLLTVAFFYRPKIPMRYNKNRPQITLLGFIDDFLDAELYREIMDSVNTEKERIETLSTKIRCTQCQGQIKQLHYVYFAVGYIINDRVVHYYHFHCFHYVEHFHQQSVRRTHFSSSPF